MNILNLSWSYIRNKPSYTLLNTLLLALGVALLSFLFLVMHQVEERFSNDAKGIDAVVSSKGSPLQIILSSIYHIDFPTGNIPLEDAEKVMRNRMHVKKVIPLALGDNYEGYRIVGTNEKYPEHYQLQLAEGKLWEKPLEAAIGSQVAQILNLKVGDTFSGAHGLMAESEQIHDDNAYKVVGVFKPSNSVADRLILTSVESVWKVHGDPLNDLYPDSTQKEDSTNIDIAETDSLDNFPSVEEMRELTALLIEYKNTMARINFPRFVNNQGSLQAADVTFELNRLFLLLGVGEEWVSYLVNVILIIAGLSLFITMYNALKERRYDLAIMRTLGASKAKLFFQILLEGILLSIFGLILGFALAHIAVEILGKTGEVSGQLSITGWLWLTEEYFIALIVLLLGIIASIIPALEVYSIDISKTLTQ